MSEDYEIGADGCARPTQQLVDAIEQMMILGAAEHWFPEDEAPLWDVIAQDIGNDFAARLARAADAADAAESTPAPEQRATPRVSDAELLHLAHLRFSDVQFTTTTMRALADDLRDARAGLAGARKAEAEARAAHDETLAIYTAREQEIDALRAELARLRAWAERHALKALRDTEHWLGWNVAEKATRELCVRALAAYPEPAPAGAGSGFDERTFVATVDVLMVDGVSDSLDLRPEDYDGFRAKVFAKLSQQ